MIRDIHDIQGNTQIEADVCLIGSGAAGITIAREFLGSKVQVVVLEAGGKAFEAPSQDPYLSEVTGLPHGGIHQGRVRQLGGSTTLWAGQTLPLFPIDFAKREWVAHSGWPISRETLLPFYRRAEDVMQLSHSSNELQDWPSGKALPPSYLEGTLVSYFSRFTDTPNFVKKYGDLLRGAPNIQVLLHSNVTSLDANETASAVKTARVRALDGHSVLVKSRYFVVCCGGIESARLLLLSDSVEQNGIGNGNDAVGRFFQDHPGFAVPVTFRERSAFHDMFDSFRVDGIRHSPKVVASEELQRAQRIHHVGAEIYYPPQENDSISAAKDVMRSLRDSGRRAQLPSALGKVLRNPHRVFAAAYRHYIRKMPPSVGSGEPMLGICSEQEPNPESRVTLAAEKDAVGKRRTRLDWRLTSNDTRSMEIFLDVVKREWERLGLASVFAQNANLSGRKAGEHGGFVDANHHMGTTRMGEDPLTSVVDAHCLVHRYSNLYVGSSSVFPTGGFSNPTLTVLALCLRIADELKQKLA